METRAVFVDNEGCLVTGKGLPFPLADLEALQGWIRNHPEIGFGICTGRSVPYVEAMSQALGLCGWPGEDGREFPSICETGAVLYWPRTDTCEVLEDLPDTQGLLDHLAGESFRVEPGKVACLSLYPEEGATVPSLEEHVRNYAGSDAFCVTTSMAAVDLTPAGQDKGRAIEGVCKRLGLQRSEVLGIGDSRNDLSMRRACGVFAAPANAVDEVKAVADFVADGSACQGVLEILDWACSRAGG